MYPSKVDIPIGIRKKYTIDKDGTIALIEDGIVTDFAKPEDEHYTELLGKVFAHFLMYFSQLPVITKGHE